MAFSEDQRKIMQQIVAAAIKHGIDPHHALAVASIESGFDPSARNGLHTGLFQFGPSEWKSYGPGDGDRMGGQDVENQVAAFGGYQADLRRQLKNALGRDPTNNELYLAHQQGGAGALSLILNPQRPATSVVPAGNITANAGTDSMTGQQFADQWNQKYGAHHALVSDVPLNYDGVNLSTNTLTGAGAAAAGVGAGAAAAAADADATGTAKPQQHDFSKDTMAGLQMMAQAQPGGATGGGGGPPQMPNLPAIRPQLQGGGDLMGIFKSNPQINQQLPATNMPYNPGSLPPGGLLAPMGSTPTPDNDPRLRRMLMGLLSGG